MSLGKTAPPLTRISQVRSLTQEDAARSVPVRLTGVITAFSGWRNSFFLQDSSAGISVDRTDSADAHVGDLVEVTGTSNAGLFAPIVVASRVRVVGQSPPPTPHRVVYEEMMGGVQDSQWIELEGVVHSARLEVIDDHTVLVLRVTVGEGRVKVMVRDFTAIEFLHLVDSSVRLRGVCASSFNEKRQFVGLEMYVPSRRFLEVLVPANRDPFATPATPIRNTLQFGQVRRRVKVTGTSTYQIPGHALYLQDGEDGIRVQSLSTQFIGPGRRVEAVGFPVMGEYAPILQDGFIRDLGPATPILPLHIQAADVIAPNQEFAHVPFDEQLVQIQGTVSESLIQGGQRVWILRQDREIFEAYLPVSADANDAQNIVSGSVLLLTGICTVHADSDHVPISFGILLRSSRDILVLERASWWTIQHTLIVLAATVGVMSGVFLWVVILRKRVEQQTRTIRQSEGRFRDLAETDVLTGLPNRLMLEDRIAECLKTCDAEHKRATVLTIDIDRFKQINDSYGHLVGDECLKEVAGRLRSIVRQTDTIARTGGEEFTLVVGGLNSPNNAQRISTQILDLFHAPVALSNLAIKLSVSIGGAIYPDDGADSEVLRKRSDQALYEAKRSGRNRAVFATQELSATLEMETAIEAALRECLRTGQFLLYYQPIFNADGAICRFEALLRTKDKGLNKMGPARFIPVAEACGLMTPIGRWVLEEACRQIAEWQTIGPFQFPIAVNVSGQQLSHQGFVAEVLETLARFKVAPGLLELELTETTAMTELTAVADAVAQLSKSGVTFAIDDFGTGYSSLSRLHMLPIKALKIDRSFVMNLEKDNGFRTIIQAVIQMAASLHLQVVAEGVETTEQFEILRYLGCDYYQGYLFARPLPAEAVAATLAENRARLLGEAS